MGDLTWFVIAIFVIPAIPMVFFFFQLIYHYIDDVKHDESPFISLKVTKPTIIGAVLLLIVAGALLYLRIESEIRLNRMEDCERLQLFPSCSDEDIKAAESRL